MNGAKSRLAGYLRALLRSAQGNVLPLAAVGMLLCAALVGGGIDMSRAYRAKNRLQSACDSATLVGRRAVTTNGFDDTARTQANIYFTTNFDDSTLETTNTSFTPTTPDNGNTVTATASTELKLAVMKVFGFQKFALSVSCQASMGVGNSDVVMVLDTTGSMTTALGSGTRISALRTAMKNFYTTVKNASAGTNARIRYGFVPYSTTVNVGRLLNATDPTYLVDAMTIQSRQAVQVGATYTLDRNVTQASTQNDSTSYSTQTNCQNALGSTPWVNNGAATTRSTSNKLDNGRGNQTWTTTPVRQPQTHMVYTDCYKSGSNYYRHYYVETKNLDTRQDWKWAYQPVSYDVSSYKTFASVSTNTADYGAADASTWSGCIEERGSTNAASFSYNSITGLSPSTALDLDVDSKPTSNDNSKWRPMWPDVAFHRTDSSGNNLNGSPSDYGYQVSSYCPYKAQLLAEMTQSDFNAYADALSAQGSTYLDIGMVWGGRLSSPTGIFADNVNIAPANGGEVSRHIIFMTDGIMEPDSNIQSAWGIEYHDRRVTSDGSSNDTSRHTSRFRAICDEIKAKGIRIWAISFTAGSNADLSYCASANSYYNASDAAALDTAFQEIAKQVGELRLTQ
jgi:Flp pilus assembly protein TadG